MSAYTEELITLAAGACAQCRFDAATQLLRLALGQSGRDAFVLYGLGHMAYRAGDYAQAVGLLDQSLAIDPTNPKAHIDRGIALLGLREDRAAFAAMDRGLEMDDALAHAVMTESFHDLRAGDFRSGWPKFEARLIASPGIRPRRVFPQPRWNSGGDDIAGRTILLHSEQGHGDAIQFVRYAPIVAALGARVLVEGHPGLLPLYREMACFSGVFALNDRLPHFDVQCPLLSLPLAFRTELASIPAPVPYLAAPSDRIPWWQRRLGARRAPRIGLTWSGNTAYAADQDRSVPLSMLEPVLAMTQFDLHVIQLDIRPADRVVLLRQPHVQDHTERLFDFGDTAALISQLDLVISVDTSVAHLAGALGKPVWVMIPHGIGLALAVRPRRLALVSDDAFVPAGDARRLEHRRAASGRRVERDGGPRGWAAKRDRGWGRVGSRDARAYAPLPRPRSASRPKPSRGGGAFLRQATGRYSSAPSPGRDLRCHA